MGTDPRPWARRNRAGPVSGANRTLRGRGGISRLNGRERGRPLLSTWKRTESLSQERSLPTPPARPGIHVRFASPEQAVNRRQHRPYEGMERNPSFSPPPLQGAGRNGPPTTTTTAAAPVSPPGPRRPEPSGVARHSNPLFQPFPIGNWANLVEAEQGPVELLPTPARIHPTPEAPMDLTVKRVQMRPPRPAAPTRPPRAPRMTITEMMAKLELENEEEEGPDEELPPPLVTFQLLMEDPSLLSVPPPAPILPEEIEEHRRQRQGVQPRGPAAPRAPPPLPFRPMMPPPPPPPRSPPPPYEAWGAEQCGGRRRRPRSSEESRRGRRSCSCSGWALALFVMGMDHHTHGRRNHNGGEARASCVGKKRDDNGGGGSGCLQNGAKQPD